MHKKSLLVIHASNVVGSGAKVVVESLVRSLAGVIDPELLHVELRLPDIPYWSGNRELPVKWKIVFEKRHGNTILRLFSRLKECILPPKKIKETDILVVLGDIPLRFKGKQIVLVHNTHLISPGVIAKRKYDFFYLIRTVFKMNQNFAQTYIVQSKIVGSQLLKSYPSLTGKIKVIPMPTPVWIEGNLLSENKDKHVFRMFYPATYYKHKNHKLLALMAEQRVDSLSSENVNLFVTIDNEDLISAGFNKGNIPSWVSAIGELDKARVIEMYRKSDALFFPSITESFGFPLVEAMSLGLTIICADLPYSRWLCEEEAIYFDPFSPASAWNAVNIAIAKKREGWHPDWSNALSKIPKNWNEYGHFFLKTASIQYEE